MEATVKAGACKNVKNKKNQHEVREDNGGTRRRIVRKKVLRYSSQISAQFPLSTAFIRPALSPHFLCTSLAFLRCFFFGDCTPLLGYLTQKALGISHSRPPPAQALREEEILAKLRRIFGGSEPAMEFEDYLPVMAEKLGAGEFMAEMCKGFELLAEPATGLITLESLRRNAAILGLDSFSDADLQAMLREGDFDGDGALSQREFCVMMIRLSPAFMDAADEWFQWALAQDQQLGGEQSQKMNNQRPGQS